jgi:hypothetical protein
MQEWDGGGQPTLDGFVSRTGDGGWLGSEGWGEQFDRLAPFSTKVDPGRVHVFNKGELFGATPDFELLFARNRSAGAFVELVIDEVLQL